MKFIEIAALFTTFLLTLSTVFTVNAQENKSVAITKVNAPAAATANIIKQGFIKAVPTYQKIEGLEFKAFSLQKVDESNVFGGIYLWKNKESAEKWFSPQWFERVKATYGVEGKVEFYPVITDKSFIEKGFDYQTDKTVTIFVQGLSEKDLKAFTKKSVGLLRSYFVKTTENYGAILLFINEQTANLFTEKKKITGSQLFNTPVLLNNMK